jgi:hypothetical protein
MRQARSEEVPSLLLGGWQRSKLGQLEKDLEAVKAVMAGPGATLYRSSRDREPRKSLPH